MNQGIWIGILPLRHPDRGATANAGVPSAASQGVSLVELMIALAISVFLIGGVISFFISSKVTYRTNEGLARVQEAGRFALDDVQFELRQIGTRGFCGGRLEVQNHLNDCGGLFDPAVPVGGFEFQGSGPGGTFAIPADLDPDQTTAGQWAGGGGLGNLPAVLDKLVVPGSDVLIVKNQQVIQGLAAAGSTPSGAMSINLTRAHGLPLGTVVLVTNCSNGADLFHNRNAPSATAFSRAAGPNCSTTQGPGNRNLGSWSTRYDDSMQAFHFQVLAYYVGYSAQRQEPGLYRIVLSQGDATVQEVVEGVENLQVLYGYALPASQGGDGQRVNRWIPASQVPDWRFVIAVRLSLLARSPEVSDTLRQAEVFNALGTQVTSPADGRMRKVFTSTVALRNQMIVN